MKYQDSKSGRVIELLPIEKPEDARTVLIYYLFAKFYEEDWHGVADAAMDLRELDARISMRDSLATDITQVNQIKEENENLKVKVNDLIEMLNAQAKVPADS